MTVWIERTKEWPEGSAKDSLASLCEEFLPAMLKSPEMAALDASADVFVVLSGDDEADHWGIDGEAVGYFAVMSPRRIDDSGQWCDVNERLEVHLELDVALPLLAEAGREEIETELEAWLTTIPHELLHVAEWLAATGGKTPVEVFDEGKGELAIKAVFDGMESAAEASGEGIEDRVEERAREIAFAALRHRPLSGKAVEALVANLWPGRPRR